MTYLVLALLGNIKIRCSTKETKRSVSRIRFPVIVKMTTSHAYHVLTAMVWCVWRLTLVIRCSRRIISPTFLESCTSCHQGTRWLSSTYEKAVVIAKGHE